MVRGLIALMAVLLLAPTAPAARAPATPADITPPSLAPSRPLPTVPGAGTDAAPAAPAFADPSGRGPAAGGSAAAGGAAALPELGDMLRAVEKATSDTGAAGDWSAPVKLAVVFTGLALVPAGLVMMTSFTRIVIVLSFVRRALTTQNIPPNIAIVGLALFLTVFTMAPTLARVNEQAFEPYLAGDATFGAAIDRGFAVMKHFMLCQTNEGDLATFLDLAKVTAASPAEVPMHVVIPAFAISEFRIAFEMGALLFIPFLLIDLVIAGILLSAGMMMLPPVIVSLPFKIILFVLVDGWALLAQSLVGSFN